jgi:hypothetical protein
MLKPRPWWATEEDVSDTRRHFSVKCGRVLTDEEAGDILAGLDQLTEMLATDGTD